MPQIVIADGSEGTPATFLASMASIPYYLNNHEPQ